MDFELSEEQRLLKDSVERLCTQRYEFEISGIGVLRNWVVAE